MTNEQKRELRWLIRNEGDRSDERIAEIVDCSITTVKRYRRALSAS